MKKILFFLVCLIITGGQNVFSQLTIPNNSFETWSSYNPEGWIGLFNSADFQNVLQSNDAKEGNYSAELKVLYHPVLMNFVGVGFFVESNFPVTGRPEVLKGFFKGTAAGSDSLTIVVGIFKNGNSIGFGTYYTFQTVSNWTYFMVPIYYTSGETADEAFISINLGHSFAGTEGTDYLIDDLYFEGTGAIDEQPVTEIIIYPNPAADIVRLNFKLVENDKLRFELINMQGAAYTLSEQVAYSKGLNSLQVSVSELPSGVYFLRGLGEKSQFFAKINIQH